MSPPSDDPAISTQPGQLGLRLRVWVTSLKLDRRLAEGALPGSSPELGLRAEQLNSARSRHALSSCLTAVVDASGCPPGPWTRAVPIAKPRVVEAAGPVVCLARDLRTLDDPPVRGVALASWLVCDGSSPLYDPESPVTVREVAQRARAALVPR